MSSKGVLLLFLIISFFMHLCLFTATVFENRDRPQSIQVVLAGESGAVKALEGQVPERKANRFPLEKARTRPVTTSGSDGTVIITGKRSTKGHGQYGLEKNKPKKISIKNEAVKKPEPETIKGKESLQPAGSLQQESPDVGRNTKALPVWKDAGQPDTGPKAAISSPPELSARASKRVAGQGPGRLQAGLKGYLSRIRQIIEAHKHYPGPARRLGRQGTVHISFFIGGEGNIKNARIVRPCRWRDLNLAALKTVTTASPLPPPPRELLPPVNVSVNIDFKLN